MYRLRFCRWLERTGLRVNMDRRGRARLVLVLALLMAGTALGTAQHRPPGAPPRPVGVTAASQGGTTSTLPEHAQTRAVQARVAQRLDHLLGVGCAWLERCRTHRPPRLVAPAPPATRTGRSAAPHGPWDRTAGWGGSWCNEVGKRMATAACVRGNEHAVHPVGERGAAQISGRIGGQPRRRAGASPRTRRAFPRTVQQVWQRCCPCWHRPIGPL